MSQLSDFNPRLILVMRPCYNPGRWVRSCFKKNKTPAAKLSESAGRYLVFATYKWSGDEFWCDFVWSLSCHPSLLASVSYCDSSHNRFLHVLRRLLIFQPKRFLFGTVAPHQSSPILMKANRWSLATLRMSRVQERQTVWFAVARVQRGCNLPVSKLPIQWGAPLSLFGSSAVLTDTGRDSGSKSKQ